MTKSSRWTHYMRIFSEVRHKVYESYVRHLPYTYISVLMTFPVLYILIDRFNVDWLVFSLIVAYGAIVFLHVRVVVSSARKMVYPDRLIRLERWRLRFIGFSILSFVALLSALYGLSFIGGVPANLSVPFNQIANFLLYYLFLLLMIELTTSLRSLQTPYRMAKLCFRVTADDLERLLKEKTTRSQGKPTESVPVPAEDVYRCCRRLKLGFRSLNDFLIQKPYRVMVKNIDQYHQRIVGFLLVASTHADTNRLKELRVALKRVFASLGRIKPEFDLREFLIALQLILGRRVEGKETTQILVDMILTKPSVWERIKVASRSPYTVVVISIVTLAVAFLQLMFQVLY